MFLAPWQCTSISKYGNMGSIPTGELCERYEQLYTGLIADALDAPATDLVRFGADDVLEAIL